MHTPRLPQIRAFCGPMTSELVQSPGDFGLGRLPERLQPHSATSSICGYCATGCSLKVHLDADGKAINLSPDPDYPVNLGMACPKGWEALSPLSAGDRATTPLLRNADGSFAACDWPEALDRFVRGMKGVQERHGAESIAFLSTGQIPTEEMALLGSLFKFGMGGLHCDSNTRQCMATAHVAYKQSFGFDAPPYTYRDFEESDVLVFIGANPAIAHPILWQRVLRNPNKPSLVVIDPRTTETAQFATHPVPVRPKGDLWLLYGIAREILLAGKANLGFLAAHTTGWDAFAGFLRELSPETCASASGVSGDQIRALASLIAEGRAVSFWWTMGVNQGHESTRTAQAIINLALMTGNIGRPGTGANSITGQCNAMGSRLFANATSLLGGRSFSDPVHRDEVSRILGIPEDAIPRRDSWAYDQIIDGIETGAIRGLWVIATNPAHSWIHSGRFQRLREKLEFLVVQDMYSTTDTARIADLVLPAAGWGEKDGTFVNSERRIAVTRAVRVAPGRALSDFRIFRLIAEAWGCGHLFSRWTSPEAAFGILRELSRGRPCDITGIEGYEHLAGTGGLQWPCSPEDARRIGKPASFPVVPPRGSPLPPSPNERRLFEDGWFFTPDGRARILFSAPTRPPELPDQEYPFWLNTGRGSSAQWHTGTRTGKSAVLRKLAPTSLWCEIHPEDATRLNVQAGGIVHIETRRGSVTATAHVTPTTQKGTLFLPMHFDGVNRLTYPAFDAHSRQPSYKACAARIRASEGAA